MFNGVSFIGSQMRREGKDHANNIHNGTSSAHVEQHRVSCRDTAPDCSGLPCGHAVTRGRLCCAGPSARCLGAGARKLGHLKPPTRRARGSDAKPCSCCQDRADPKTRRCLLRVCHSYGNAWRPVGTSVVALVSIRGVSTAEIANMPSTSQRTLKALTKVICRKAGGRMC